MRSRLLLVVLALAVVAPVVPASAAYPGPNGGVVFSLASGDLGYIAQPGAQPVPLPRVTSQNANDAPHFSPDGNEVAFVFNGPFNSQIWSYSFAEQRLIQYTTDQMSIGQARSPSWLPDGSAVVFVAVDQLTLNANLYTVPRGGGLATQLSSTIAPSEPHVSPAGDQVLFWDEVEDRVMYYDLRTGQVREVFRSDVNGIWLGQNPLPQDSQGRTIINFIEPDWAPDGQSFVVNCLGVALCRVSADGQQAEVLTPVRQDASYVSGAFTPSGEEILYSHVDLPLSQQTQDFVPRIWAMPATGLGPGGQGGSQVTFPFQGDANANNQPTVGVAAGTTPPPVGSLTTPLPPGADPGPGDPGPGDPGPGDPGPGGAGEGAGASLFATDPSATQSVSASSPNDAAIQLSQARFPDGGPSARWAVLSRDDDFPDSLAGTALTSQAPMLLTERTSLDPPVEAELTRLLGNSGTVYLLGGVAALSEEVEEAISDLGLTPVRLAGPGRVQTALAVASEVKRVYPDAPDVALLARAGGPPENPTAGWADSVSAGSLAADRRVPIVLTDSASLLPEVSSWLTDNGVQNTVLLGGSAALAAGIEGQVPGGTRVSGGERTETAANLASSLWLSPAEGPRSYVVINGGITNGWAFGLVAAGVGADADAPTVVVVGDSASPATRDLVTECGAKAVRTLTIGDSSIVAQSVVEQIEALDGAAC